MIILNLLFLLIYTLKPNHIVYFLICFIILIGIILKKNFRKNSVTVTILFVLFFLTMQINPIIYNIETNINNNIIGLLICPISFTIGNHMKNNRFNTTCFTVFFYTLLTILFVQVISIYTNNNYSYIQKRLIEIPIGNSNYIAIFIAFSMIVINNDSNKFRVIIFSILGLISIILTQSRTSLFVILIYYIVRWIDNIKTKFKLILVIIVPFIVLLIFKYQYILFTYFTNDIGSYIDRKTSNPDITNGRIDVYMFALNIFLDYPLLGVGYHNLRGIEVVDPDSVGEKIFMSHNLIIDLLAQSGIIGTIIFSTILYLIYNNLKKQYKIFKDVKYKNALYVFIFMLIISMSEPCFFTSYFDWIYWLYFGFAITEKSSI